MSPRYSDYIRNEARAASPLSAVRHAVTAVWDRHLWNNMRLVGRWGFWRESSLEGEARAFDNVSKAIRADAASRRVARVSAEFKEENEKGTHSVRARAIVGCEV